MRPYPTLRSYLKGTGESQTNLARRLGISKGGLNDIIQGRRWPSVPLARHIEDHTGVPFETLIGYEARGPRGNVA